MTAFRCDEEQLAEITRRARAHRMTRTSYMIAAALGDLPEYRDEGEARFARIEERLDRVERMVSLSIDD